MCPSINVHSINVQVALWWTMRLYGYDVCISVHFHQNNLRLPMTSYFYNICSFLPCHLFSHAALSTGFWLEKLKYELYQFQRWLASQCMCPDWPAGRQNQVDNYYSHTAAFCLVLKLEWPPLPRHCLHKVCRNAVLFESSVLLSNLVGVTQ